MKKKITGHKNMIFLWHDLERTYRIFCLVGIRPRSWRAVNHQSPVANRQEESELADRQGKILDLKNLKKNVSHFLVLKD